MYQINHEPYQIVPRRRKPISSTILTITKYTRILMLSISFLGGNGASINCKSCEGSHDIKKTLANFFECST